MEPDEAPDLLTMESELDRVDRWVHGADSANPSPPQNTPDRRRVSDNHVIALVNEVRRLRASRLALAERVREACKAECLKVRDADQDAFAYAGACYLGICGMDLSKLVEDPDAR